MIPPWIQLAVALLLPTCRHFPGAETVSIETRIQMEDAARKLALATGRDYCLVEDGDRYSIVTPGRMRSGRVVFTAYADSPLLALGRDFR